MEITNTKKMLFWFWVTMGLIILFTLVLFNQSYARNNDFYDGLSYKEKNVAQKMERKYLRENSSKILRFKGDAEIEEDELITGDVLVLKGTLQLDGEVEGDVIAIFGDIELGQNAFVDGDVISVNGKVWTEDESNVKGDIVVTNVPIDDYDDEETVTIERKQREEKKYSKYEKWPDDNNEVVWADYNRVDGITLGMQFPRPGWWANNNHNFALLGKGGYSFASKRWQYQLGLERGTSSDYRFAFGGEFHDLTDTQDKWIICDHENGLAAFFIKEDFRDYYNRCGYSLYASQNFGKATKLLASYQNDDFRNMEPKTTWSLFGRGKSFRPNPYALPYGFIEANGFDAPLNIKSVAATLSIDTRNDQKRPTKGWHVVAFAERAGKEMQNEIEFERYIVNIAHYMPLSWDENITFRIRAGSSSGILPPMYWYDLGGLSTLRGFQHKEYSGDRMVLGNIEYCLRAGDANFLGVDFILFVDSGLAWFANEDNPYLYNMWPIDEETQESANQMRAEDTFEDLTWASLKTDAGFAIASPDGDFRINFARRIDIGGQDIVITFRLCKPF